jgi:hypothetical protein
MKYTIILLISGIIFGACSNSESPQNEQKSIERADSEQMNAPGSDKSREFKKGPNIEYAAIDPLGNISSSMNGNSIAPSEVLIADRKMIWNADLEFRVKNLDKSFNTVRTLCQKHSGYISDMERTRQSYEISSNVTVRVVNDHFHDLVAAIKGESEHLDVARITSEDVTEEYLDTENRLETKRKARERYIEILRTKTGTIEDVIQAEEAIRRITEEIEAKEGRLRYLSDQMEFSTIIIRMYKPIETQNPQIAEADTYGDQAQASFSSGWSFIKGFGLAMIAIWPLLLILGAIVIWKRKWIRGKFPLKVSE